MGLLKEIRARQTEPPPDPAPGPPEQIEQAAPEPGPDGITRRFMNSKVLGVVVPISWTPDGERVFVDGVCYSASEVKELLARRPDAETMRGIHCVKKTFEGTLH